jgi:6-phospho-3-hexuloisomerase
MPHRRATLAAHEILDVVGRTDPAALESLTDLISRCDRVFSAGHGRSGLIARAVSMRLMHLGLPSFVVAETSTPAIRQGDVLWQFTSSGGGEPTLHRSRTAAAAGARIAVFTANADSELTAMADVAVVVPVRDGSVESIQHAGSLFEQASLVLGDSIAGTLQHVRGLSHADLDIRHANLV